MTVLALFGRTLVLALVVAVCAWWSIVYTRGELGFSSLWVGSGVLCGFLLTSPRREWLSYLLGALVASVAVNFLLHGLSPLGVVLSFANTLDAWIVAALVNVRIVDVRDLTHARRTAFNAMVSTVLACTASGVIAALAGDLYAAASAPFATLFRIWFVSHALGMVIFATLTIVARVEGQRLLGKQGRRLELVITLCLITAVCWLVFTQSRFAITFLVFPPLLLCVFRHRFSGFVPGMAIVAVIATMETASGHGPFMMGLDINDVQRTLIVQSFIASLCFLAFPIATVLTERKVLMHRLARSEHSYSLLADHSSDLIGSIGSDNMRRYISPSVVKILGWSRGEFAQPRWDLLHAEDVDRVRQTFAEVSRTGTNVIVQCRMQHKQGHYVWMELHVCRVPGEPPGIVYAGRDMTQRMEAQQELERLARHDVLTGLGNRRYFDEQLALAIARSIRHGKSLAVLCVDIDHFKRINDTHGHAVGDAVLCEFASRLRSCVRSTDFAARLGGDEFIVLVEDIDSPDAPQMIADKLVASLRDEIVVGAQRLHVTTSIGIAEGLVADASGDELLRRADAALYEAKAAGRNTWRIMRSH